MRFEDTFVGDLRIYGFKLRPLDIGRKAKGALGFSQMFYNVRIASADAASSIFNIDESFIAAYSKRQAGDASEREIRSHININELYIDMFDDEYASLIPEINDQYMKYRNIYEEIYVIAVP